MCFTRVGMNVRRETAVAAESSVDMNSSFHIRKREREKHGCETGTYITDEQSTQVHHLACYSQTQEASVAQVQFMYQRSNEQYFCPHTAVLDFS